MNDAALLVVAAFLFGLPIYFLPTFVAVSRGHRNTVAIFLLNFFLGWLLVGWVGALVWAVIATEDKYGSNKRRRDRDSEPTPFDPLPEPAPVPVYAVPALVPYTCPHCGYMVRIPPAMVGAMVTCGTCRHPFHATPPAY
ncbi:superinfection immunity protein [Gemmata sp.]|uniref:superinfection immunity protein n=1 Tax=Gemmata sp. TaxID=1914242 RepID=UPI003F6EDCC3